MKCAIYHRVSTIDQDPALAREELHRVAKAKGLEVVLDIEETGSGANNDRPGLQKILEAARRGKIAVVLVWKLDRWGRSALDLLSNIKALQSSGCRFIATTQGLDVGPGGDTMSQLMITVLAGVAEFERSIIVERTRLGIAKARAEGKHLGRPLAEDAPAPEKVSKLRDKGFSWSKIGERLNCHPSAARRALCRNGG